MSVLLKAGHLHDDILTDIFYNAESGKTLELSSRRSQTCNTHGTGCTMSSAFAAALAHGKNLDDAARDAKNFIAAAIEAGSRYTIGHGHGPVHHFHNWWQ